MFFLPPPPHSRGWGWCLDDAPVKEKLSLNLVLPGALYSAAHQCRLQYGSGSLLCDDMDVRLYDNQNKSTQSHVLLHVKITGLLFSPSLLSSKNCLHLCLFLPHIIAAGSSCLCFNQTKSSTRNIMFCIPTNIVP